MVKIVIHARADSNLVLQDYYVKNNHYVVTITVRDIYTYIVPEKLEVSVTERAITHSMPMLVILVIRLVLAA